MAGIVTFEDLIEQILQEEIEDEQDAEIVNDKARWIKRKIISLFS